MICLNIIHFRDVFHLFLAVAVEKCPFDINSQSFVGCCVKTKHFTVENWIDKSANPKITIIFEESDSHRVIGIFDLNDSNENG